MSHRRRLLIAALPLAALLLGVAWVWRFLILASMSWPRYSAAPAANGGPASILDLQYAAFGGSFVPDIVPMKGWPARPITTVWSRVRLGSATLHWYVGGRGSQVFRVRRAQRFSGPYAPMGSEISTRSGTDITVVDSTVHASTSYFYTIDTIRSGRWVGLDTLAATTPTVAIGFLQIDYHPFLRLSVMEVELDTAGVASLVIFNKRGDQVRRIFDGFVAEGAYQVAWDWTDDHGHWVAPGTYVARLRSQGKTVERTLKLWTL